MSFTIILYVQLCCVQLVENRPSSPRLFKLTCKLIYSVKLQSFTLPPSNSNLFSSISAAAAAFCLHVYRLPSISLPSPSFIFSSQMVCSPWADLFMSNGVASCFFPSFFAPHHVCSKQATWQPAERTALSHWMDGCIGGGGWGQLSGEADLAAITRLAGRRLHWLRGLTLHQW